MEPLKPGRPGIRETEDVRPVAQSHIDAALPHVSRQVRDMVKVQVLTGARPGEVCRMRADWIDQTGEFLARVAGPVDMAGCWVYLPERHKTRHHGHHRIIPIGPEAQAVLKPYLEGRPQDSPLFSPREAVQERAVRQRQARKTKVQPSQQNRNKGIAKHGTEYTTGTYQNAITRACKLAKIPAWTPGQLRHTAATNLERQFGWEVARIVCGHRSLNTTRIYVATDLAKAFKAIAQAG